MERLTSVDEPLLLICSQGSLEHATAEKQIQHLLSWGTTTDSDVQFVELNSMCKKTKETDPSYNTREHNITAPIIVRLPEEYNKLFAVVGPYRLILRLPIELPRMYNSMRAYMITEL
jgi:hypothetical protein